MTLNQLAEFDGPMHAGPVIEVNTEQFVDVGSIACRVRELLNRSAEV
jgi:hypothetical protein